MMKEDIVAHAASVYPLESCGLIYSNAGVPTYFPCRNISKDPNNFTIDPEDWVKCEELGEILKVVHSHPNLSPMPSQADLVSCEQSGLPWIIVSYPNVEFYEFTPSGYIAPLVGREFSTNVLDCLSIIRDYYKQVLSIDIPNYYRDRDWFERGQNLFLDRMGPAGFVQVEEPKEHDIILMRIGSPVPNHGGVLLGAGTLLHHQLNRLSCIDVYGGWFRKTTTHYFRHKELL